MYAIVDIAGQQFKVQKDQKVLVNRLEAAEGSQVEFERVLLVDDGGGKISVGKPLVDGYRVAARVLKHIKGEKVLVFKKKRRKGYAKLNGHRQYQSTVLIQAILSKGETFTPAETEVKKAKKKTKEADETEASAEVKETKKTAVKKTAKKKD